MYLAKIGGINSVIDEVFDSEALWSEVRDVRIKESREWAEELIEIAVNSQIVALRRSAASIERSETATEAAWKSKHDLLCRERY